MKRLKFKKPFNGMDNAKKLIPESYKVNGKEFEMTDGNETYRIKWSSLINEGIILTSSNKAQINEDMSKIKHLMGFKAQDTLGTVKGAARLDENKKFGDVLDKTKKLINESAITEVEEEIDESIEEGEHIKSGMGGSNKGKSRTDKTEVLKKDSKKKRRKADKEATKDINEDDVEKFQDALASNPKVVTAAKRLNTPIEKINAADQFVDNISGGDEVLRNKMIRAIKKDEKGIVEDELENSESPSLKYYDGTDSFGFGFFSNHPYLIGLSPDEISNLSPEELDYREEQYWMAADSMSESEDESKEYDLPTPPSYEKEQSAQIYEDRFDEVFEGIYEEGLEESEINENSSDTYFETLSETLDYVREQVLKMGYTLDEDDLNFQFGTGGISYGQTKSAVIPILKNGEPILGKSGKPLNRGVNIVIYRMDSGRYELTFYKTF